MSDKARENTDSYVRIVSYRSRLASEESQKKERKKKSDITWNIVGRLRQIRKQDIKARVSELSSNSNFNFFPRVMILIA